MHFFFFFLIYALSRLGKLPGEGTPGEGTFPFLWLHSQWRSTLKGEKFALQGASLIFSLKSSPVLNGLPYPGKQTVKHGSVLIQLNP